MVSVERLEKLRWRVSVDGRRLATFCSESRARAAGRLEARRLNFAAFPTAPAAMGVAPGGARVPQRGAAGFPSAGR
jgi:hypothetical protein